MQWIYETFLPKQHIIGDTNAVWLVQYWQICYGVNKMKRRKKDDVTDFYRMHRSKQMPKTNGIFNCLSISFVAAFVRAKTLVWLIFFGLKGWISFLSSIVYRPSSIWLEINVWWSLVEYLSSSTQYWIWMHGHHNLCIVFEETFIAAISIAALRCNVAKINTRIQRHSLTLTLTLTRQAIQEMGEEEKPFK